METQEADLVDCSLEDLVPSDPKCGCCLAKVSMIRDAQDRGKKKRVWIVHVRFRCRCQTHTVQCFLCGRCPDCCRCPVPAWEKRWSAIDERRRPFKFKRNPNGNFNGNPSCNGNGAHS